MTNNKIPFIPTGRIYELKNGEWIPSTCEMIPRADADMLLEALRDIEEHCNGKKDHKDKWTRVYSGDVAAEAIENYETKYGAK